ncbi:MAG: hypothetical protein PHY07_03055 [Methanosarcina sp.]|nr:hypothetical protein [Methanosarcina sp.]
MTKRDRDLFLKTGVEALKLGKVPQNNIKDVEEYMKFIKIHTVKHNVEAGIKIWLSAF